MGNCCDSKGSLTDNTAENLIRNTIAILKIRKFHIEEIERVLKDLLGVSLFDIELNPHKWIPMSTYNKLVDDYFLSDEQITSSRMEDCTLAQRSVCVAYNKNDKDFHFNLLMWIMSLVKSNRSDKIKMIKKVILRTQTVLTFNTLRRFLIFYLNLLLVKTTNNFEVCDQIHCEDEIKKDFYMLTNVYNKSNINDFVDKLMGRMKKIVIKGNRKLNDEDICNEFLKESHLRLFFEENFFLLDMLELRNEFYSREKNYFFKNLSYD